MEILVKEYAPYLAAVAIAFIIVLAAQAIKDWYAGLYLHCDRVNGGYNCRGESCEGCYRITDGEVDYHYPQPMNDYGKAPLTQWGGRTV